MKNKLLVLNLKMNFSEKEMVEYSKYIKDKKVIVLPQYPYIFFFRNSNVSIGSQDVSKFNKGNYTGEVCAKGLKSLGVQYCLIGHFERKKYFNETINDFRMKMNNANESGLIPIYCINQTEEEYVNDKELKCIEEQLEAIPDYIRYIIIAFEPTWLIGSDSINIDIDSINKSMIKIKEYLMERNINHSIIYGGGVNLNNIDVLEQLTCLDGYILSSSALDVKEFDNLYNRINEC